MIRLSSLLAGLALGALVAPIAAQDVLPISSAAKYAGRFDVGTNTFYPSSIDPDTLPVDATVVTLYDNATTNGYFSTGGGTVVTNHHVDWGTFTTTGGLGASITEFRIAYNTSLVAGDLNLRIRLNQGTVAGSQGTVLGDFIVGPVPVAGAWIIDVDISATPVALADGAIGWSYNVDLPVGGSTTSTGPLLAGPPSGAGTGINKGAPATGFGAYQKWNETTGLFTSTATGASPVCLSFAMRLKGRETGAPPSAWQNYGVKKKVTFTGEGSATPGSVDNVLHVTPNPGGASFILVAGLSQSDFFLTGPGLHFYAHPWLVQLPPITSDPFSPLVNIPAILPAELIPGTKIYMQCFGTNLAGSYINWSEGLELTVQ